MEPALPPQEPHLEPPVTPPQPEHQPVERLGIAEMIGEFLREAAVLVAVFIPLDLAISDEHNLTISWGIAIVVLPVGFFAGGVWVERTRRQ